MKFNNIFKRSILGDYDRDGVMNAFDCKPKNKRKQDGSYRVLNEDEARWAPNKKGAKVLKKQMEKQGYKNIQIQTQEEYDEGD